MRPRLFIGVLNLRSRKSEESNQRARTVAYHAKGHFNRSHGHWLVTLQFKNRVKRGNQAGTESSVRQSVTSGRCIVYPSLVTRAVSAKDGVEAVECAYKIKPDIFLAEVSMPKMNGIEAAKQIKKSFPDTRIICFSGHAATSELIDDAKAEGYEFNYLAKPIKPEVLLRTIRDEKY
ncbi:MAG: response regulator [Acidobacteria bacterium]|nr:response regulator [Acidobacteriota bacterium]